MTRRDFALIAVTIHELDVSGEVRLHIARRFARRLAEIHPNFDPGRFLRESMKGRKGRYRDRDVRSEYRAEKNRANQSLAAVIAPSQEEPGSEAEKTSMDSQATDAATSPRRPVDFWSMDSMGR